MRKVFRDSKGSPNPKGRKTRLFNNSKCTPGRHKCQTIQTVRIKGGGVKYIIHVSDVGPELPSRFPSKETHYPRPTHHGGPK